MKPTGFFIMEKNFTNYFADDFIADESFQDWATNPNEENKKFWIEWMQSHPEKNVEIQIALSFIHNLQIKVNPPGKQQVESSLQKNLAAIASFETVKDTQEIKPAVKKLRLYWMAAAVIFFALTTASWYFITQKPVTIQLATGNNEIKTIVLPDSSRVVLNANSSIIYPTDLLSSGTREVWLEGEAFFNVKHIEAKDQPAQRFIVHTGDLNVEVLGTAFNIRKIASFINITLNSGKIKIDLKDQEETAIYLKPGEFVQYSPKQKHILKKQVNAELYSVWKDEKLSLVKVPLSDIATLIRDIYGYTVTIEDEQLADTKISGTLRLKDENTLLKTLEIVLDITIKRKDSLLIFQRKINLK